MTDPTDLPPRPDPLEAELIALGRTLVIDAPPDLADRVLAQLAQEPAAAPSAVAPSPSAARPEGAASSRLATWFESRRRRLATVLAAAALLVIALVPPVRAAVLELFRIGGVTVREVPAPSTTSSTSTQPLPSPTAVPGTELFGSVAQASGRVGFDIAVPPGLGPPTTIAVTRQARVVELTWDSGSATTRLDVFLGSLDFGYLKSVWTALTPTRVGTHDAVWFGSNHEIQWIDRSGTTQRAAPRVAGPTLVWVDRGTDGRVVTYRLEGQTTLTAARAIAESAR